MAIEITYDGLMETVEKKVEEKAVKFTAKDGKVVTIRPLGLVPDNDLKPAKEFLKQVQKLQEQEDVDLQELAELLDKVLICAADKKDSLKKSLVDFPVEIRMELFNSWMEADKEQGEASDSES